MHTPLIGYHCGLEEMQLSRANAQLERLSMLRDRIMKAPTKAYAIFNSPATRIGLEEVGVDHQAIALESITAGVVAAVTAAIAAVVALVWKIIAMIRGGKKGELPDAFTPATVNTVTSVANAASEETIKNMAENAEKMMESSEDDVKKASVDTKLIESNKSGVSGMLAWLMSYGELVSDRKDRLARYKKELPKLASYMVATDNFLIGIIKDIESSDKKVTDDVVENVSGYLRKMKVDYPDFDSLETGNLTKPSSSDSEKRETPQFVPDNKHELQTIRREAFSFSTGEIMDPMWSIAENLEKIYQMQPDEVGKLAELKTALSKTMMVVGRYLHSLKQIRVEVLHAMMTRTMVNTILSGEGGGVHANKNTSNLYESLKKEAEADLGKDQSKADEVEKRIARLRYK